MPFKFAVSSVVNGGCCSASVATVVACSFLYSLVGGAMRNGAYVNGKDPHLVVLPFVAGRSEVPDPSCDVVGVALFDEAVSTGFGEWLGAISSVSECFGTIILSSCICQSQGVFSIVVVLRC